MALLFAQLRFILPMETLLCFGAILILKWDLLAEVSSLKSYFFVLYEADQHRRHWTDWDVATT
jgi:hypothetical protein